MTSPRAQHDFFDKSTFGLEKRYVSEKRVNEILQLFADTNVQHNKIIFDRDDKAEILKLKRIGKIAVLNDLQSTIKIREKVLNQIDDVLGLHKETMNAFIVRQKRLLLLERAMQDEINILSTPPTPVAAAASVSAAAIAARRAVSLSPSNLSRLESIPEAQNFEKTPVLVMNKISIDDPSNVVLMELKSPSAASTVGTNVEPGNNDDSVSDNKEASAGVPVESSVGIGAAESQTPKTEVPFATSVLNFPPN